MRARFPGFRTRAPIATSESALGMRERQRQAREDRAEILRLIERLRAKRKRLASSRNPRDLAARAAIDATLEEHVKRLGADAGGPRVPRVRAPLADAPLDAVKPAAVDSARMPSPTSALQRLEERLARIEDRLVQPAAAAPSPAGILGDYTFAGIIQGDLLSDVLQMISSNALTGIFTVESDQARHTIHVREGQIIHAQNAHEVGEAAFFAAFATTRGRYTFRQTSELPADKTIDANTQFLILEALRRIDEQGSDSGEAEHG